MNMAKPQLNPNPDGYNPPNLFAGLNMSTTTTQKVVSQPIQPQTAPIFPSQSSIGDQTKPQLNVGKTPNVNVDQPGAQLPTQPGNQPMSTFSSDPNSIFFGMQPTNKSFENNETSGGVINTSTDYVQAIPDQILEKDRKEDQSRTADDSSKDFANLSRISQNEGGDTYNPPNLFENLNISNHQTSVKESNLSPSKPDEKVSSTKNAGLWNSDQKSTPKEEKKETKFTSIPDFKENQSEFIN